MSVVPNCPKGPFGNRGRSRFAGDLLMKAREQSRFLSHRASFYAGRHVSRGPLRRSRPCTQLSVSRPPWPSWLWPLGTLLATEPMPRWTVPTAAACTRCPGCRLSRVRLLLRWASTATVNSRFDMKPFKWKSSFTKLK